MAMEVSCGSCSGRLMVETFGVIVACPHCGVHLSIPDPDQPESPTSEPEAPQRPRYAALTTEPDFDQPQDEIDKARSTDRIADSDASESSHGLNGVSPEPSTMPNVSASSVESPSSIFHSTEEEKTVSIPADVAGWLSSPHLSLREVSSPDAQGFGQSLEEVVSTESSPEVVAEEPAIKLPLNLDQTAPEGGLIEDMHNATDSSNAEPSWAAPTPLAPTIPSMGNLPDGGQAAPAFEMAPVEETTAAAVDEPAEVGSGFAGVVIPSESVASGFVGQSLDEANSRLMSWLMIVGSYASLTTILLAYLFLFGRSHQLESLPDLKTVPQMGGRAVIPRPENDLPWGHELRFGQTQRYGDLRVTPLRVTRGPISFEHGSGDQTQERTTSDPVLKLWLKFENVSAHQAITPLDTTLMFFRRSLDHRVASYNVIFRGEDRKKKNPQLWYPFDRMLADSEWLIVGQHTNEPIEPHKSLETFIPSEENFDGLTGDVVWRVHFRKGYGPKTHNGVTTLIDVHFHSDEIKPDAS